MKRVGWAALAVVASIVGVLLIKILSPTYVEIPQADMGYHYCLYESSGASRAPIRDLKADDWVALQSPPSGPPFTTCDATISVVQGSGPCYKNTGDPPSEPETVLANSRLEIVGNTSNGYDVTLRSTSSGSAYTQIGQNGKFSMGAVKNKDGTFIKYLLGQSVPWVGKNGTRLFDIYIYNADAPPSTLAVQQTYRIEFFDTDARLPCKNEEPSEPLKTISPAQTSNVVGCVVAGKASRESPIGDGHHPKPNSLSGTCP